MLCGSPSRRVQHCGHSVVVRAAAVLEPPPQLRHVLTLRGVDCRCGVPQVIIPKYFDQFAWASIVEDLGVGVRIDAGTVTTATVSAALAAVTCRQPSAVPHWMARLNDLQFVSEPQGPASSTSMPGAGCRRRGAASGAASHSPSSAGDASATPQAADTAPTARDASDEGDAECCCASLALRQRCRDVATQLHSDADAVQTAVDVVVAWLTEAGVVDKLRCIP